MMIATIAAVSAYMLSSVSTGDVSGPLAWQLIGTDPDVYAPALHQPAHADYFRTRELSEPTFLHPRIGMPFAALRIAEQCEQVARSDNNEASMAEPTSSMCSE